MCRLSMLVQKERCRKGKKRLLLFRFFLSGLRLPGEQGDKVADLDQLTPEAMFAAPIGLVP
jgi:hypothetical protein